MKSTHSTERKCVDLPISFLLYFGDFYENVTQSLPKINEKNK